MKTKMKKNIFTFIAISLLGFLTGCSENDVLNDVQGAAADQASNVVSGTASFNTDEVDAMFNQVPETRATFHYNSQKKLSYRWNVGEKIPVFMCYKQGNMQKVVEDEVYAVSGSNLKFKINIPAGFDRRRGDLYIGAVMGKVPGVNNGAWASDMTDDGKVKIEGSHTVDAASDQFNLPFYVPLTKVNTHGDINIHFKALGSWLAVTLNVQKDINPDFIVVNSDVVSTNGTLDLFSSGDGVAAWQPDAPIQQQTRFTVKNYQVKAKQESKPLTVWFMPILNKESQQATTVSVNKQTTYSSNVRHYSKEVIGKNEQLKNNKVYNVDITEDAPVCDKGLVITQFWSTQKNKYCNRNVLQITNISDHEISLEGYYLVRSVFGSAETPSGVIDLGKLEENNAQFLYNHRQKKVLPSGASLLITGFNRRVAEGAFDYCEDQIYQIALLGEDENLLQQFAPECMLNRRGRPTNDFRNAYFLTFNGTDISLSKPNNIVDNFGRDACGRIYNFQFLNRTYYRIPYCDIFAGEQGLGGEATHLYKPERRVNYIGSYWGPMENFNTCSWRFENETKITSLGYWGKYGVFDMSRKDMY